MPTIQLQTTLNGNIAKPTAKPDWEFKETYTQMNIYVSNLSNEQTWEKLNQAFEVFGEVTHVVVICDERAIGRKAEQHAYVEMPIKSQGNDAISKLNRTMIGGRIVSIIEALPLSKPNFKTPSRKPVSN